MTPLRIDFHSIKPIYLQIAEAIEDDIITGKLVEGNPVYSQLVLSKELGVNPATAAKGINTLVQKGTLEKQRGLSMTVAHGARINLIADRQENGLRSYVRDLVSEAKKITLPEEKLVSMIHEFFTNNGGSKEHE